MCGSSAKFQNHFTEPKSTNFPTPFYVCVGAILSEHTLRPARKADFNSFPPENSRPKYPKHAPGTLFINIHPPPSQITLLRKHLTLFVNKKKKFFIRLFNGRVKPLLSDNAWHERVKKVKIKLIKIFFLSNFKN